jgi:hypothetical protein
MAGPITTGSTPKLLWPGLTDLWGLIYEQYPQEWKELFPIFQSGKNYEEDVGLVGMGLAEVKPEGTALKYDTMKQTFVTRYTNVSYAKGYIITREEIDDCLYNQFAVERTENVAYSMVQTKENVGANIFNRAFNNSYPGGDGVSMINASHPTEGGLLSNTLDVAANLSEAALEDALIDISQFRDPRNNHINIKGRCLAVPSQLAFEATRILKNPQRPDTANRDISAMYQMGVLPEGIKENHYFTDTNAWFILTNAQKSLKHYNRVAPKFEEDNEFSTKNKQYSGYERYSFGWTDWRGVYGSPGV